MLPEGKQATFCANERCMTKTCTLCACADKKKKKVLIESRLQDVCHVLKNQCCIHGWQMCIMKTYPCTKYAVACIGPGTLKRDEANLTHMIEECLRE